MKTSVTGGLYIVSAPSGAGKTSLINAYFDSQNNCNLYLSISYTTRSKRAKEQDNRHYHFVNTDTFNQMIESDAFIEYANVFGYYYGSSRDIVQQKLSQGIDVFLEIDWQGARQVRQKMLNICTIFILPPSRTILENRLRSRGQDQEEVIAKRMAMALQEISHYNEYDYLIVNDDFYQALTQMQHIIKARQLQRCQQEQRCATLLKELLEY